MTSENTNQVKKKIIRLILLDFGGTLVDLKKQLYQKWALEIIKIYKNNQDSNTLVKKIKHQEIEEWKKYSGKNLCEITNIKLEYTFWEKYYINLLTCIGFLNPDKKLARIMGEYRIQPSSFYVFDDVFPVLKILEKQSIPLGIVSNAFPSSEKIFEYFNFNKFFDIAHIYWSFQTYKFKSQKILPKPDHSIYKFITQHEKISPDQILFIDDRNNAVTAAINVGWTALRICRNKNETHSSNTISSLYDILTQPFIFKS